MTRFALFIIRAMTPAAHREFVDGDTAERFEEISRSEGRTAATRWLYREMWRAIAWAPRHWRSVRRAANRRSARRGDSPLRTFWMDVRYGARVLRHAPTFTAVAVGLLALGIGGSTSMFAVVHAVLLKPLPFKDADRLMLVQLLMPVGGGGQGAVRDMVWSYPKYRTFAELQNVFDETALYATREISLTHVDDPEPLRGEMVTDRYLATVGVVPALGRSFTADEAHRPGTRAVAMVSDGLWARRFGSDAGVIGRTIHLNTAPYTIVGVLPRDFRGLSGQAEIWVPQAAFDPDSLSARFSHGYQLIARRAEGTTEQAAIAAVQVLGRRVDAEFADGRRAGESAWGASATALSAARVDADIRRTTLVMLAAVGFLLMIAAANVTGLLATRALARRREVAIRLAIGASRVRIVRQHVVETVLLAGAGAAAGLLVALTILNAARALLPDADTFFLMRDSFVSPTAGLTRVGAGMIGIDSATLLFTLGLFAACAVLIALLPAAQASSLRPIEALKSGAVRAGHALGTRAPLVVAQIALALVLLAGAGLMVRSVWRLQATGAGVDAEHVLSVQVQWPRRDDAPEAARAFFASLAERVQSLPGVDSAALGSCVPVSGGCARAGMTIGGPATSGGNNPVVGAYMITPEYLPTLGVKVLRGRSFTAYDDSPHPRVVLVNEAAARAFWPGRDPLGSIVGVSTSGFQKGAEVIGVVSDVRYGSIEAPAQPDVYLPVSQLEFLPRRMNVFVRSGLEPGAVVAAIRREVRALDPNLPLSRVTTMEDRMRDAIWRTRLSAWLLGAFAALALLLTAVGIVGVMVQTVTQRSGEMAVRIALGAQSREVLSLVLRRTVVMTGAGLALGLAGALALSRLVAALLYDVPAHDPATLAAAAALLGIVALVAGYVPARRATSVDAIAALKAD
ncbi:MAG TPA: ADOP family duplicated permease [Vicinamibacterales bacterium]|nr:ADOP family duplicated permease [Vicinamibacterales bacterium]